MYGILQLLLLIDDVIDGPARVERGTNVTADPQYYVSVASSLRVQDYRLRASVSAGSAANKVLFSEQSRVNSVSLPFRCLARRIFPAEEINNNPQTAG